MCMAVSTRWGPSCGCPHEKSPTTFGLPHFSVVNNNHHYCDRYDDYPH